MNIIMEIAAQENQKKRLLNAKIKNRTESIKDVFTTGNNETHGSLSDTKEHKNKTGKTKQNINTSFRIVVLITLKSFSKVIPLV